MKKILLIQFRTDASAFHEKKCLLRFFKKKRDSKLKTINVFNKINFSFPEEIIKDYQGVILGGSGEFYFSGNKIEKEKIFQEMLKRIDPFIRHLFQKDFPTLGICFGHQMLGYFLGTKVIADKNQSETGSFLVSLSEEGKTDLLFSKISKISQEFFAQFGHKDSLEDLPKNTKFLAKTERCKVAVFKYKNNIYGVQFHPELNMRDMVYKLKLYPEYGDIEKIKKTLKPTPFTSKIIRNFLKLCV